VKGFGTRGTTIPGPPFERLFESRAHLRPATETCNAVKVRQFSVCDTNYSVDPIGGISSAIANGIMLSTQGTNVANRHYTGAKEVPEMNRFLRFLMGLIVVMLTVATTVSAVAQTGGGQDPLVQVLVNKGILTAEDAKTLTGTPAQQHDQLVQLLREKGVLSAAEAKSITQTPSPHVAVVATTSAPAIVPAVMTTATPVGQEVKKAPAPPPPPTVIPAMAPIRVLQTEPVKPGGLIPDIRLGSKASLKLYGYFKTSAVYDTSSPYGDDFPLPGFIADSGPNGSPEFHLKARNSRFGANFEFPDVSPKVAITGRLEFDWEGNFTRVDNRNISSIRSSMPSLRLAWGRIDYKSSPQTGYYFLAGQDWSPFGSSILPNTLETTGVQIGFGSLYERDPQLRVGMSHDFGGDRHFIFEPDFAISLPGFGDVPPFIGSIVTTCPATGINVGPNGTTCTTALGPGNLGNQLGYGERQGPDSGKPEVQGRLVFQFQADRSKGVAPAQIVFSGMHANRQVLVTPGTYSLLGNPATLGSAAQLLKAAFPRGAEIGSSRYGWTAGFTLPTRWVTLLANYYRGTGLRWYFAGQVYPEFNDTSGLKGVTGFTNLAGNIVTTPTFLGVPSIDGSATVLFGLNSAGALTPVPQREPRAQGGFVELEFPLSRIFNAEPTGRNAGWTATLHYGLDTVLARDVRKLAPAGGRGTGDVGFANLQYKMNQFVTLGYELSYYRTRAVRGVDSPFLPPFEGVPAAKWHDIRSEFATIFTF
jgi:hypothetical protein